MDIIEINSWKRAASLYRYYQSSASPLRRGTALVDTTRVEQCARRSGIAFPVVMMHAMLSAVNTIDAFRIRVLSDQFVARYDVINLVSIELDDDHSIYYMLTPYHPSLVDFRNAYRAQRKLGRSAALTSHFPINSIALSYLPQIRLTQIDDPLPDSPIVRRGSISLMVGKSKTVAGQTDTPVSLLFSHALLDGYDISQALEYIEQEYGK